MAKIVYHKDSSTLLKKLSADNYSRYKNLSKILGILLITSLLFNGILYFR